MESYISSLQNGFKIYEYFNFKEDIAFISEIKELLRPSYVDTAALIEREINHNSLIYYTRDEQDVLSSFFMSNFDIINTKIVSYLGLLAVKNEYKASDLTAPVMLRQIQKLKEKEIEVGYKIRCWATTASIGAYHAVSTFYDNLQPTSDGWFSEKSKEIAFEIVNHYKLTHDLNNPFILKNVAKNTLYSDVESIRIEKIRQKKKFNLFGGWGIEEKNGDRMIMLAESPSDEKLNRWLLKIGIKL